MQNNDHDFDELLRTLSDNFSLLADEVQLLSDRKTILEHKLRFAHEQYQHLADKYAPSDLEIASTLAKLQLPPELQLQSPDRAGFVPLPSRKHTASKQQTAVAIRDGRQASHKLAVIRGLAAASSGRSLTGTGTTNSIRSNSFRASRRTILSTVLEQDFTVPGKKSELKCPYAPMAMAASTKQTPISTDEQLSPPPYAAENQNQDQDQNQNQNPTASENISTSQSDHKSHVHHNEDPICAAMYAESLPPQAARSFSQAPSASGSAPKCPIRFLDQHSPEEVAHYFETHKHEIPRSHEICVKRYQRNEDDIRKLDAKYGNLVSMIQGLGHKHQPMLPTDQEEEEEFLEAERKSNERVENWANGITGDANVDHDDEPTVLEDDDDNREGRFERQLKEVRVGESPSRPWGISVPFDARSVHDSRPASPVIAANSHLPAPVLDADDRISTRAIIDSHSPPTKPGPPMRCPFGFDQPKEDAAPVPAPVSVEMPGPVPVEVKKGCPFDHTKMKRPKAVPSIPQHTPQESYAEAGGAPTFIGTDGVVSGLGSGLGAGVGSGNVHGNANGNLNGSANANAAAPYNGPPMVFTGPVFIGYPVEQALVLLQGLRGGK